MSPMSPNETGTPNDHKMILNTTRSGPMYMVLVSQRPKYQSVSHCDMLKLLKIANVPNDFIMALNYSA